MKKILLILLLVVSIDSFGQNAFSGGIMVGPVTTQISGDGLAGWNKFGVAAGPWVNMPISEKAGITLALKYITKGSRTRQDTLTFQSFGYYLNYIDVPVLFTYRFPLGKSSLMASLGPYAGVLLNQKIKANGNEYSLDEAPYSAPFEKYDIGISGGVAWWAGQKIFFELSTTTSILPTRPAPNVVNRNSYYEQGNYNQTLQFMVGLRFGGSADE